MRNRTTTRTRIMVAASLAAVLLAFGWKAGAQSGAEPGEMPAPPSEMLVVTGTIEAVEQNLLGTAKAVQIVSAEMGEFRIADDENGRALTKLVGRTVTVTAHRTLDPEGQSVLSVSQYVVHEG